MANNRIQIKRSVANSTVTGLNPGELAFTANGNILYIGNPADGASVRVAGLQVPGTLTANQALVANSTSGIDKVITANLVPTTIWANGAAGTAGQVLTSNSSAVYWATPTTGTVTSVATANGLTGGTITSSGTLSVVGANGISVTTAGVNVLAGNTQLTSNSTGLWVIQSNIDHNSLSNYVANRHVDHSAVSVTAGNGLTGGGDITTTRTLSVLANNGITSNSSGVFVTGANGVSVTAAGVNVLGGSTLTVNSTGVHVNSALSITDLSLSGNLTVLGTLSTIDTTNLTVKDSIIELANGNTTSDLLDIGLYGQYAATGTRFTGLFRDATDGLYKLFANSTVEPTTTVDIAATGYVQATLQSWLSSGALVSNGTNLSITANSSLAVAIVANTLSLTTALPGTSGGTGKLTVTNNAILVGNSTNGYNELTLNTNAGYVLQSNGTALVYDWLDGGTF